MTHSIELHKTLATACKRRLKEIIHGVLMPKSWASLFVWPISHFFIMLIAKLVMSSLSTARLPHTDAAYRGDQKLLMFCLRGYKTCRYNVKVPM